MSDFIFQGGSSISEDDFRSHLNSLCQLENVGVLLGAGASVKCGGMTMKDVWLDFVKNNSELIPTLLTEFKLVGDEEVQRNEVNVEKLIDQVTQFLSVHRKNNMATQLFGYIFNCFNSFLPFIFTRNVYFWLY
jgi:hypothetical protein